MGQDGHIGLTCAYGGTHGSPLDILSLSYVGAVLCRTVDFVVKRGHHLQNLYLHSLSRIEIHSSPSCKGHDPGGQDLICIMVATTYLSSQLSDLQLGSIICCNLSYRMVFKAIQG